MATAGGQRIQEITQGAKLWIFILSMILLFTLVLSINLVFGTVVEAEVGEPAPQNVDAPEARSYISEVSTRKAREQAMASVADIYTEPDLGILRTQLNRAQALFNFVDVVRLDSLASVQTKVRYLTAVEVLSVTAEDAETILDFTPAEWSTVKTDILRIVEEVMRRPIEERTSAVNAARNSVRTLISINLTPAQERMVTGLAAQFIVANSMLDEQATAEQREQVAANVEEQRVTIREGQPILREGEPVTEEQLEMLAQLGLLQPQTSWSEVASLFVASLLAVSLIALYWYRFQERPENPGRHLLILGLLLFIYVITAKTMLLARSPIIYLLPAAALAMLLATVFGLRLSLFVTLIMAGLLGYASDQSLELAVYAAAGPIFAVLILRDSGQIITFFRAGLVVGVTNMVVILLFRFALESSPVQLLQLLTLGLINGVLISAGITLGGFYILGGLFGVLTILQLQELSRLDHPLLQELLRRAPGTYHHSIMVANLAEQAAERVRARSALVRVGAFYHDIGKMNRPPFFTENQEGVNPHDSLDPYISARIIISHVADGLELGRKYRLPGPIKDFIAQHHGNRLVAAFYAKALEQAGGDESKVERERFRYKGPRPRSREAGIVLLADSVEAASAALRPDSEEAIVKLVNRIVEDHLKEGQLDNSGLTMGDLEQIRLSFMDTLRGRFHVRVRYPGNEDLDIPAALPAGVTTDGQPRTTPTPLGAPILSRQGRETP